MLRIFYILFMLYNKTKQLFKVKVCEVSKILIFTSLQIVFSYIASIKKRKHLNECVNSCVSSYKKHFHNTFIGL